VGFRVRTLRNHTTAFFVPAIAATQRSDRRSSAVPATPLRSEARAAGRERLRKCSDTMVARLYTALESARAQAVPSFSAATQSKSPLTGREANGAVKYVL
jgi:hypothetical protein